MYALFQMYVISEKCYFKCHGSLLCYLCVCKFTHSDHYSHNHH